MNDDFDPLDHGIENDEIAKIHAMADMAEERKQHIINEANNLYSNLNIPSIDDVIKQLESIMEESKLSNNDVCLMLDNLIVVFEETQEFEKCARCIEIKKILS